MDEREQFYELYLPIIKNIAASIMKRMPPTRKRGIIEEGDLVAEGFEGLVQALERVDRTDPGWHSFLYLRIRGAMLDFIRRQGSYRRGQKDTPLYSLDITAYMSDDGERTSFGDMIADPQMFEERVVAREAIQQNLTEQEQQFLLLYLSGFQKKEIALRLGVSPSRSTQLYQSIIDKLKCIVEE